MKKKLAVGSNQLSVGWQIKAISDVIIPSGTIDPRKNPDQTFQYVDVSSVSNTTHKITEASVKFGRDAPSRARRFIRTGDVLFATIRPTLKRIALVPKQLDGEVCSTGYFVFRAKPEMDGKFLFYYLFTDQFMDAMESLQSGASYPAVNDSQVRQQEIAFPSLPEQKLIVAILDEAFAGISQAVANAEKNLANARELFESYLNNVFTRKGEGWVMKRLSEVCEGKITDGTHQTPKYFDDGYVFLSSKNVVGGVIDWDNVKYLDIAQHEAMQKRLSPRLGDVLLAKNGTTGVAAIVDRDTVFDIYVSLALLRPSELIHPRYLLHFINSAVAKAQFNRRLKGVGVPNLHLKEIRDVVIPYPELMAEQERLVVQFDNFLEERWKLETIYQQKLAALSELKQSILQKAFAGQLTRRS